MNKLLSRVYAKAKAADRICARCGWIVTVKDWQAGCTYCAGCAIFARGNEIGVGG